MEYVHNHSDIKDMPKYNLIKFCKTIETNDAKTCEKIIVESNKNVNFYLIEYADYTETVKFYTDREVDISAWKNRNSANENFLECFLKELKNLIVNPVASNEGISLYELSNILNNLYKQYEDTKHFLYNQISKQLQSYSEYKINNISFDNVVEKSKIFEISFDIDESGYTIRFKENNEDIFISSSIHGYDESSSTYEKFVKNNYDKVILRDIYPSLLNIFKLYNKFYDMFNQTVCNIKPINFNANLSIEDLKLVLKDKIKDNILDISYSFKDNKIINNSNSSTVISLTEGAEALLFKKVYISREDLPNYLKEELIVYENKKFIKFKGGYNGKRL